MTETISYLFAAHEKGQAKVGVNVEETSGPATVGDMTAAKEVFDLYAMKESALRLCVDAVVTVLRVDQIIQAKQAGGPKLGAKPGGNWDDED